MSKYRLEQIEGIGKKMATTLAKAGLTHTHHFLDKAATAKGRKALAAETGIEEAKILKWANMADLIRIKGVGEEFSELLEAAGVDTVKELKTRRPETLTAKLVEVNTAKKLCRRTPAVTEVARWIEQAKSLAAAISH